MDSRQGARQSAMVRDYEPADVSDKSREVARRARALPAVRQKDLRQQLRK